MDWLAVSAVRMIIAVAAIPAIVRARHGVKTESAQWDCDLECTKGMFAKIKPCGFTLFARRYGVDVLLDCLEKNEKNGVIYHREGSIGDYDDFEDVEELIQLKVYIWVPLKKD